MERAAQYFFVTKSCKFCTLLPTWGLRLWRKGRTARTFSVRELEVVVSQMSCPRRHIWEAKTA